MILAVQSPGPREVRGDPKRIRTLVADDSFRAQEAVAYLLERDGGIEVVGRARDGREALEQVQKLRPDLVLLDLQMPKMNGLQVTSELRKTVPEARIIIVTLHDSADVREICLAAGADGFVPKNRLHRDLTAEIHRLFELNHEDTKELINK